MLRQHVERCRSRATALGFELPTDAFLFSGVPDGSTFLTPDSVTQRYDRMVIRLGIETTLHKLRHYSATELIAGGVDPRTVAGRLGYGGAGRRRSGRTRRGCPRPTSAPRRGSARGSHSGRSRSTRPNGLGQSRATRTRSSLPHWPVRSQTGRCRLARLYRQPPPLLPSMRCPYRRRNARSRSRAAGVCWNVTRGADCSLASQPDVPPAAELPQDGSTAAATSDPDGEVLLDLTIRHRGNVVARFSSVGDPNSASELQQILADAVLRRGGDVGAMTSTRWMCVNPTSPSQ